MSWRPIDTFNFSFVSFQNGFINPLEQLKWVVAMVINWITRFSMKMMKCQEPNLSGIHTSLEFWMVKLGQKLFLQWLRCNGWNDFTWTSFEWMKWWLNVSIFPVKRSRTRVIKLWNLWNSFVTLRWNGKAKGFFIHR